MNKLQNKIKKAIIEGRKIIIWAGDIGQAYYLAQILGLRKKQFIYLKEIGDLRGEDFNNALLLQYGYWYKKFKYLWDRREIDYQIHLWNMEVIEVNNIIESNSYYTPQYCINNQERF